MTVTACFCIYILLYKSQKALAQTLEACATLSPIVGLAINPKETQKEVRLQSNSCYCKQEKKIIHLVGHLISTASF